VSEKILARAYIVEQKNFQYGKIAKLAPGLYGDTVPLMKVYVL